jgi:hypothetical protein
MTEPDYNEIRQRVEKRYKERTGLIIHSAIFLMINAIFWLMWAFLPSIQILSPDDVTNFQFPWPIIITLGWGAGMVAHCLDYYHKYGGGARRREEAIALEVEREMARRGYSEKPKRDHHMRLTEDGELEEIIDEDEYDSAGSMRRQS